MVFVPTKSQQKAINTLHCPLAVTAGAGSGKTRVLVERYLNLVNQGIPVEKIAAITFTKKAAQEMRDRLRLARPDLIEEFERAQISTIHSLCQRIIHEHSLEAAIDPRFRIGEEWENMVLLLGVIQEEIEGREIPEEIGGISDATELVLTLYDQILTRGIPVTSQGLAFLMPLSSETKPDFMPAPLIEEVDRFLLLSPNTKLQKAIMDELNAEWVTIQELLCFPDWDLQLEGLQILEVNLKKIRGNLRNQTEGIRTLIAEGRDAIYQQQGQLIINWLYQVLDAVHYGYEETKREAGILDFHDLERLALKLLQEQDVVALYRFAHLMVDEFQDTNPIQKQIIDRLVEQGAILFVVGDPKQSIYRFRGADVGVFGQTQDEISQMGENVFLAENFRSRPELIEFANHLFSQIMKDTNVAFEASLASRESVKRPCVTLLRTSAKGLNLEEGRQKEAEQIAAKIRQIVEKGDYRYEQIAVLFRSMTNVRLYERALQAAGVPYVNLSGRGFFAQQEIRDILHYFSWLQDYENDLARLAVLRSPFYLISDNGLFWLRENNIEKLNVTERCALDKSEEDYQFLTCLYRSKGAPEVITALLERTDYLKRTWRLPFGPQRVANVEKLLAQSWQLFTLDLVSMVEQARYIGLMASDKKGEGEALLEAEHADVVALLTIHGAKGLEFPVVFLPDTSGALNRPKGGLVRYHPDFGLAYRGTVEYECLKKQEQFADDEELRRLLYVAVTRAEEEVYWCGLDELSRGRESWWKWLQSALPQVPQALYREVEGNLEGNLTQMEAKATGKELKQLQIPRYQPLTPRYDRVAFSVTALMSYARCPRYYYFRYILQVPELVQQYGDNQTKTKNGVSALQRGNIVHRVCEQIEDISQLANLLTYAAESEGVDLSSAQRRMLERIVKSYLGSDFFRRIQHSNGEYKVFRELEFVLPVGEFLINGLIDQVFLNNKHLEIVDFKSNWIRAEQVEEVGESYEVQLRLYAWAMTRRFMLPVKRSQAYFLIPNMVYQLENEYLDPDQTQIWLHRTCREIICGAEQGVAAFYATRDCQVCEQRAFCGNYLPFGENTSDKLGWT